jgi:hypothetical protein
MTSLSSIKLPTDLIEDARRDAAVFHRSIGGQVEHWARIGRAFEKIPGYTLDRVRAALDNQLDPGVLSADEWAIFADLRVATLAQPTAEEEAHFAKLGEQAGAVGVDPSGQLVRRRRDGTLEVLHDTPLAEPASA